MMEIWQDFNYSVAVFLKSMEGDLWHQFGLRFVITSVWCEGSPWRQIRSWADTSKRGIACDGKRETRHMTDDQVESVTAFPRQPSWTHTRTSPSPSNVTFKA